MNRTRTVAAGIVAIAVVVGGCATPGSVSARSGVEPAPASSASPAPASSADPAPATSAGPAPAASSGWVGFGPPACAPASQFTSILGPNVTRNVWTSPTVHKPFGDVGVDFGPQMPGATVLWARLDVMVTDTEPIPGNPTADPSAYSAAEEARPDSFRNLTTGTDPYVARVTLKPYAPGPFVVPAAVLNALPSGVGSYTVYLVQGFDESGCNGTSADASLADPSIGAGFSVVAELVP